MQHLGSFDLIVVGGGVNGVGIARDAAGRGLTTLLCEKGDLAEGTSSRSSKLVHGGLRYLEHLEFRLVREALIEREVLLRIAPHIVWPMRFVLPHGAGQRPAWMVRAGLFLYDHLGGRKTLPPTRSLDLAVAPEGRGIRPAFRRAFEYSDCWVDDARLVVVNALDLKERGGLVRPRTPLISARREADGWRVVLRDEATGAALGASARALVNAAGPWVEDVLRRTGRNPDDRVRLIKGSHLVVRKFWRGDHAYLLQNDDGRVVFVIPYEDDFGLIGTTDIPFDGAPETVAITTEETAYLLDAVHLYFDVGLEPVDVLHAYAGVRPLYNDQAADPSAVTRDYVFDVEAPDAVAPLLTVFGGKITTYRRLAEHALDRLAPFFPRMGSAWTGGAILPGGDLPGHGHDRFAADLLRRRPWLPAQIAADYGRRYGARADDLLGGAGALADLGRHFGAAFYEGEARFLVAEEWARTAEDILMRRTKHGLHLTPVEREVFADWLARLRV
ncbi:MAG: glycerol-3-phosphate dehydrogenase [Roseiarcus sp.]